MLRRATLVTALLTAQVVAIAPPSARAATLAPSPEEVERARVLDENARQLYDEGSYQGAILAWETAYELTGYNNLLYNISMAYDRSGNFEKALEVLDRYRALAPPEERPQLERRKKSLKARLEKQRRDAAEAEGEDGASEDVPMDEPSPTPEPMAQSDGGGTEADTGPRLFTPAAWVLVGTGTLGFGLGIGFGTSSLLATRRAEDGCADGAGDTVCSTTVQGDVKHARTRAIVADVGIAVGAVSTVAVVAILAVQAKRRKRARAAAIAPAFVAGGGGISIGGRF